MHSIPKIPNEPASGDFALQQTKAVVESRIAKTARVNLLIIGPETVTESIVRTLWRPDPARTWTRDRALEPPMGGGLLFLQDVGHLTRLDQQRLKAWLNREAGRTQVISTSPAPIMLRVATGAFDSELYYRLNTVCVNATET